MITIWVALRVLESVLDQVFYHNESELNQTEEANDYFKKEDCERVELKQLVIPFDPPNQHSHTHNNGNGRNREQTQ